MINGVSAASESSVRIRSPMEFPWLLYWISFKFVTLSGAMLIAARYESSRLRGVHLSFRGELPSRGARRVSLLPRARARTAAASNSARTVLCIRNDSYAQNSLPLSSRRCHRILAPVTPPIVVSEINLLPRSNASIKRRGRALRRAPIIFERRFVIP